MNDYAPVEDVGAPDPELRTSPISDARDQEPDELKQEVPGEPVCYFNGRAYATGVYVKSGTALYKCDYGIWVPSGPADADNP